MEQEDEFCFDCFDEVCSRCSTSIGEDNYDEEISLDGLPLCVDPPTGAEALTSGTTVSSLSLKQGYYRTSKRSHVVVHCYQEEACPGSDVPKICSTGYQGPCESNCSVLYPKTGRVFYSRRQFSNATCTLQHAGQATRLMKKYPSTRRL